MGIIDELCGKVLIQALLNLHHKHSDGGHLLSGYDYKYCSSTNNGCLRLTKVILIVVSMPFIYNNIKLIYVNNVHVYDIFPLQ